MPYGIGIACRKLVYWIIHTYIICILHVGGQIRNTALVLLTSLIMSESHIITSSDKLPGIDCLGSIAWVLDQLVHTYMHTLYINYCIVLINHTPMNSRMSSELLITFFSSC